MSYPDIANLIQISNLMHVTVDALVRDEEYAASPIPCADFDADAIRQFRLRANLQTYAACMKETVSSRPASHDFRYEEGPFLYRHTYLGGERFAGEEAVWKDDRPVYAMNYSGRVLDERFNSHFLKEALRASTLEMPYRG